MNVFLLLLQPDIDILIKNIHDLDYVAVKRGKWVRQMALEWHEFAYVFRFKGRLKIRFIRSSDFSIAF